MKTKRGFTLIELMTAVAILSIVVAGISQVLIKQSQASVSQNLQRDQEESGRLALLEIASSVRMAGYGISPLAAFDFDRYACTSPGTSTSCNGGSARRDRIDGPDEMVVLFRDPSFSRLITGNTTNTISFTTPLTTALPVGTILQVVSVSSGSGTGQVNYLKLGTAAAAGALNVTGLSTLAAADGYLAPSTALTLGGAVNSMLTRIYRVRYFVANDPNDGVPALWKERGNGNEMLYRGIEDVQYTYDIGAPPNGSRFAPGGVSAISPLPGTCSFPDGGSSSCWTLGANTGTVSQPDETATAPDWQNDLYDSANRYTINPANIRSVTISIVARSRQTSPDKSGDPAPAVGNRPARTISGGRLVAPDQFKRTVLQMTEQTSNLLTRMVFAPIILSGTADSPPNTSIGGG